MKYLISFSIIISIAYGCNKKECDPVVPNEKYAYRAVYTQDISEPQKCGKELKLIYGFGELSKLTSEDLNDSLLYHVKSLPISIGDTIWFNGRAATLEEQVLCNQSYPYGSHLRQVVITNFKM